MATIGKIELTKEWQKLDGAIISGIDGTESYVSINTSNVYEIQNESQTQVLAWDGAVIPADDDFGGFVLEPKQRGEYKKGTNDLYLRTVGSNGIINLRDNS